MAASHAGTAMPAAKDLASSGQAPSEHAQAQRFDRFVTWTIRVFWVFLPLDVGIAILLRDAGSVGLAATLLLIFAFLHLARRTVRRGQLARAVSIAAAAILLPIPLLALFRPHLYPVLAMGSVLSVAAAVPFVNSARLRQHAIAGWAISLVVIGMGVALTDPWPDSSLPPGYAEATFAAALAFVLGLILFMLVAFSGRLGDTLAATRDAHARVEAANVELRKLDELKTQFMNNAAHELNTPLTPIRLQLHLLRVRGNALMPEERTRVLGILDRSVSRMELLSRDLLDATRLQAGRLRLEVQRVDLGEVVADRVDAFEPAAREAGVRIESRVPGQVPVQGDPHRLGQIVDIYLTNALKFTPRGGGVRLVLDPGSDVATVSVHDDGVGIGPDDMARLFQPFTQVGAGQHVRGTGLGLYIAKGIAQQHGGRVWAQSPGVGRGSTFFVAVPRLAAEAAIEVPREAPQAIVAR